MYRRTTITPPATPGTKTRAWATLVTSPSYVAGLLTLHRTMSSLSSYPLLVMTTPGLPQSYQSLLRSHGLAVVPVSHLSPPAAQHPGFDPAFVRLNDAWTKLQVFGLTEYDKVILVDADMIFLKDMDELFDLELPGRDWIGAAPACVCNPLKHSHYPKDWVPANCSLTLQKSPTPLLSPTIPSLDGPRTSHLLNSGLVILHPSIDTLNSLIHYLNTSPTVATAQFADQDVIAEAFKGRWRPLPWWCNALKTLRGAHKELWKDEEVGVVHYILDKPWSSRPSTLPPHQSQPFVPTALPPSPSPSLSPASSDENEGRNYQSKPVVTRRPLPAGLLEAVRDTPKQVSLTDYSEIHEWWWIVYEDLLDDYEKEGINLELIDQWVTR